MRIRLTIAYTGTKYSGWQIQKDQNSHPTIQGVIEMALFALFNTKIRITGAGRTDAGVHAHAQIAHFDLDCNCSINIKKALNALLPYDIRIIKAEIADGTFHARSSAIAKTYIYEFWQEWEFIPPQLIPFVWQCGPLAVESIHTALSLFKGKHDFAAFQNKGTPVKSTIREVYGIELREIEKSRFYPEHLPRLQLHITANGFLKQMVRNIAGALVYIGKGKIENLKEIIESGDRQKLIAPTAPARGLTLARVHYS